jgi:hypothetical protein
MLNVNHAPVHLIPPVTAEILQRNIDNLSQNRLESSAWQWTMRCVSRSRPVNGRRRLTGKTISLKFSLSAIPSSLGHRVGCDRTARLAPTEGGCLHPLLALQEDERGQCARSARRGWANLTAALLQLEQIAIRPEAAAECDLLGTTLQELTRYVAI